MTPAVAIRTWVEDHDLTLYRSAVAAAEGLGSKCPAASQLQAVLALADGGPYGSADAPRSVRREVEGYARVRKGRRLRDKGAKDPEASFWAALEATCADGPPDRPGPIQALVAEAEAAVHAYGFAVDDAVTEAFVRHLVAHLFFSHVPK